MAAIVLNYNGREVTLESLASLTRMDYPAYDLIVVDNGSTDGSFEAVAEAYPELTQVRTEKNLWAAGGVNLGIGHALERGYDYLLILNNDIEVDPAMLGELVRAAQADPSIGCVGPKAYYHEAGKRDRLWSAGGVIRFKESCSRERGNKRRDRGQFDRDGEVSYVNGCAMLVPRRVMEATGLWDPVYHLALEDADWCMRMKAHGFRCWYAHRAVLWHMVAFTAGGYTARRTFQTGRSSAIFCRRYATPWNWLTYALFTLGALPVAFVRELLRGRRGEPRAVAAKLRGVLEGLRLPLDEPPGVDRAPKPDAVHSAGGG